ncbi:unnamed protein product [Heligmosomoides polygyrus]|uniref:GH26 domain-containing protein n=2 Tax=Heligmosomoides polygyrus TaxID=6339 RepID=A0A3P8DRS4_HELPZ|nr:lysozyme-2 [Heligmosomoides bakeri]VDP36618.1 unnamed protein product [Heligmosomoides polygyrus]
MRLLILLGALSFTCHGIEPAPAGASKQYAYAVDFSAPATASAFRCIKSAGYSTVFLRAYDPTGQGRFDSNVVGNVHLAAQAGLGIEVYMTPQIRSYKNGTMQFKELIDGLTYGSVRVRTVWVQVTSPIHWDPYTQNNIAFLNQIMMAAQRYGINIGFYTNNYDWSQIANNAWVENAMLWYWRVNGGGPQGETPANFDDYHAFGHWYKPTVKQFAQVESVCGITVNRDVYALSMYKDKSMAAMVGPRPIGDVVGETFNFAPIKGLLQTN